jgi:hypothetical protein
MARVLPFKNDDGAVPTAPPRAVRRSDLLVVVICTAVFGAEFGVVLGGVLGLLPFGASPVLHSKTPTVAAFAEADGGEAGRAHDPEGVILPPAAEPLSGPSSAPPAQVKPVAASSTALTGAKVHSHRAHVSHPARSGEGGDHHPRSYRAQHALTIGIYQPGGRAPGW